MHQSEYHPQTSIGGYRPTEFGTHIPGRDRLHQQVWLYNRRKQPTWDYTAINRPRLTRTQTLTTHQTHTEIDKPDKRWAGGRKCAHTAAQRRPQCAGLRKVPCAAQPCFESESQSSQEKSTTNKAHINKHPARHTKQAATQQTAASLHNDTRWNTTRNPIRKASQTTKHIDIQNGNRTHRTKGDLELAARKGAHLSNCMDTTQHARTTAPSSGTWQTSHTRRPVHKAKRTGP